MQGIEVHEIRRILGEFVEVHVHSRVAPPAEHHVPALELGQHGRLVGGRVVQCVMPHQDDAVVLAHVVSASLCLSRDGLLVGYVGAVA